MAKNADDVPYPLTKEAFRRRLWAVQQHMGWTRRDMARICDVTTERLDQWYAGTKSGGNFPRFSEMIRLGDQTGVSLDWIYQGKIVSMLPSLAKDLDDLILNEAPFEK